MAKYDFNKDELFCKECYLHDMFFRGGGSWAPDSCPICKGTATIMFEDMDLLQRIRAVKLFNEWKNKS